jgi:hypothetical protein
VDLIAFDLLVLKYRLIFGDFFRGEKCGSCEARNTVLLFGIELNYISSNHLEFQTSIAL